MDAHETYTDKKSVLEEKERRNEKLREEKTDGVKESKKRKSHNKRPHIQNMTEGKPIALIIAFAIPLMLGNVFQQLYSVVDSMVVGKFLGVDALAALGATTWPNWVILGFLQGLTQGFSIVMSQAFGAQDGKKLRRAVGNSAVLSALGAVVLFLFGQIFARAMLGLLSTPEEIVPYAMVYLRISFLGIPVITGYNLFAAILRALGDGQTPLRAMAVASIVNVLLDLLFVTVFGWGIAGAAIATVTAQLCSCILCFNRVRKIEILALARSDFRLDGRLSKGMFILSMPMALQNLLIAGGGMIVQSVVNRYGMVFIAGFTAGSKLHGVLEIATSSYGFAMTTYVGQNLGAVRMDRIHKGVRSALVAAVVTSAVIAVTMLLSGHLILSGFVSGTGTGDCGDDIGCLPISDDHVCLPPGAVCAVYHSLFAAGNGQYGMADDFRNWRAYHAYFGSTAASGSGWRDRCISGRGTGVVRSRCDPDFQLSRYREKNGGKIKKGERVDI